MGTQTYETDKENISVKKIFKTRFIEKRLIINEESKKKRQKNRQKTDKERKIERK